MATNWDEYAAEWEANQATHTYAESAFDSLTKAVSIEGKHVLDFGCGTGLMSQKLAPFAKDIVALDSSEAMIEKLDDKQLENVEPVVDVLSRGLVAFHPAFRKQFDLIVASSVCGFLPNYSDVMDIVYSLLDEGGQFVQWDWLAENDSEGLTANKIERVLSSVGFNEVTISTPFEIETPEGKLKVVMGVGTK
ncbi:class I SAM-dependent DNA methyltransferase [Vibrio sp. TRT 21S02]|uniref:class I SAM-dependent DNA methyltransferase n=1 Tax=Vibrio sp. TRT 21S02 TaxID=3418507 RepID=UPI003CF142B0